MQLTSLFSPSLRNRAQPSKEGAKDANSTPSRKNSVSLSGKISSTSSSSYKGKASSPVASGASGSVGAIGIPPKKIRRGSEGVGSVRPMGDEIAHFSSSAGNGFTNGLI